MFRYDRMNLLAKEKGVKKAHLCRLLGKTQYYLRDAEKANTDIKGEALSIIAEALGTTPEYLTGESDDKNPAPVRDGIYREVVADINGLSPEDVQRVAEYVAFLKSRGEK